MQLQVDYNMNMQYNRNEFLGEVKYIEAEIGLYKQRTSTPHGRRHERTMKIKGVLTLFHDDCRGREA